MMTTVRTAISAALATVLTATSPAVAADSLSSAEKLRRLDIMLMVTGLRCRTTSDNFNAEYGQFTTSHMPALNQANAQLRAEMVRRHGQSGANRQLDRLSTVMANNYGQGHPWLSCRELKKVARDLSQVRGEAALVEAAGQLLSDQRSPSLARVGR